MAAGSKPIWNPINVLDIYGWMIAALSVFAAAGVYTFGWQNTLPQIIISLAATVAMDAAAKYVRTRRVGVGKGAIITGLFIGQLLPLSAAFYLPIVAAAVAVASKNLIRVRGRQVFNPTLFSMLVLAAAFSASPSWWGSFALPASPFPMLNVVVVAALGVVMTFRQRRHDLVWPFLGAYFLINLAGSYLFPSLAQFSVLVDATVLYALFFMLVEPKTSPMFRRSRLAYGVLAAVVYVAFNFVAPQYNLIAMVLVSNLFVLPLDRALRG